MAMLPGHVAMHWHRSVAYPELVSGGVSKSHILVAGEGRCQ